MSGGPREILFEMTVVGSYVRVCAIDGRTGREVIMVGDPSIGIERLKRLAARKLDYVMNKDTEKAGKAGKSGGAGR
ncbi:MAG: DUF6898 family protein [Rhodospirillales bacterium]